VTTRTVKSNGTYDGRLRDLEQRFASVVTHLDTLAEAVRNLTVTVESLKTDHLGAPKPQSVREHLITAATAATVVAGLFAGMNWWFDASYRQHASPLQSTVAQHQRFLDPLQDRGKLHRLFDRVQRLEDAMKWKPELRSYDRIGRAD